nr:hypothetical protein [uncultured Leptotrichia sp.]
MKNTLDACCKNRLKGVFFIFKKIDKKWKIGYNETVNSILFFERQTADIKGGINFGIDTCWVNLLGKDEDPEIKAKYKVDKLSELYEII